MLTRYKKDKINVFLSLVFREIAHILLREELRWFYLRLKREQAIYYYKNLRNRISPILFRALLIVEDQRFYTHEGIDLRAIFRAIWHYFRYRVIEGASTIEQQLTRVIINRYERTIRRKIHEMMLASCVKEALSKDEILGVYLNVGYFGYKMRGVENICKELGYDLENLSPVEAADIIVRIRHPQPHNNLDRWKGLIKQRRNEIAFQLQKESIKKSSKRYETLFPGSQVNKMLTERYPRPLNFRSAATKIDEKGKEFLYRAFISEGIPAAFQKAPLYFENIRELIAKSLDIHPKNVVLIGSARLGYSFTPKKYGNPVNRESDLDFALVSHPLFKETRDTFYKWKKNFETSKISPNKNEEEFWKENLKRGSDNIKRGFLDINKIPSIYPLPSKITKICDYINQEINKFNNDITPQAGVFIRIYKDWDTFFTQSVLNLNFTFRDLKENKL